MLPVSYSGRFLLSQSFGRSRCLSSSSTGDWRDTFRVLSKLSQEEAAVRASSEEFANAILRPRIVKDFRHETFDQGIYKEMGKRGFLGMTISGFGCAGLSNVAYGVVAQQLEAVDSAYRSAFSVQNSLVMKAINDYGSDEQRRKWLPALASGECIGCFGLTEPNHGSDPSSMETKITWSKTRQRVLTGNKTWITAAPIADVAIVWARDYTGGPANKDAGDPANKEGRVRGLLIEMKTKGVSSSKIEGKLSLRASCTGSLAFDEVILSESSFLPDATGLKSALGCLNSARLGIAFGVSGAARDIVEKTLEYAGSRKQFGVPLSSKQLIQKKLADCLTKTSLMELAAFSACKLKDENNGVIDPILVSMVKRNNCMQSLEVARICRDMFGANGVADEFHVMRHMMNLEAVNTYEGTEDVHALIIGKAMTGISSF